MKRLYFDTETTGFLGKTGASLTECPHIVQLAAILWDDQHGEVSFLNVIIKPDGWIIPDGAAEIHGITTEKALAVGIPIKAAMAVFTGFVEVADEVIAHNIAYDEKLVAYELDRLSELNLLPARKRCCTMLESRPLVQALDKNGRLKNPNQIEAHHHFFGEGFDGAHDALADVRACQRIHAHLIQQEKPKAEPAPAQEPEESIV